MSSLSIETSKIASRGLRNLYLSNVHPQQQMRKSSVYPATTIQMKEILVHNCVRHINHLVQTKLSSRGQCDVNIANLQDNN